jgi:putative spermidine/putrescine transport system substrate-binding protein
MRTKRVLSAAAAVALAFGLVACGSNDAGSGGSSTPANTGGGGSSSMAAGSSAGSASDTGSASASGSAAGSGSGSASASGSSSAPSSGSGQVDCGDPDSLTFASDGDVNIENLWKQTMIPAFNKVCPDIKINFVFDVNSANVTQNVAKIAGALKSGNEPPYDLLEDSVASTAAQAGLTEPLTEADVPALPTANQTSLKQYNSTAVPWRGSAVLLAYDSSKVTDPPKTLADLLAWIKANPGQFIYNDPSGGGSGSSFVETVIDSNVSADDLKKMQTDYVPDLESKWDKGFETLKGLTQYVYQQTYPHGNQDVLNLMASGAVSMAPVWSDQFLTAKTNGQVGDEWKVTQISDPPFTGGAAFLAIVKGDKHKKAAATFINWVLQPEQQAQVVRTISGFPSISIDSLPSDVQGAFGNIDVQNLRSGITSKMGSDMKAKWTALVAGG